MRPTEYFDKITCSIVRNGRTTTPPRAELRFNDTRPAEFSLNAFVDLDHAEPWTLSVDMFERLCANTWRSPTVTIVDDGVTIKVINVLSMMRKQVAIDFDIEGKPATQAIIPLREIKRFMRVIKRARKAQSKVQRDYAKDGIAELDEYLANL